MAVKKQPFVNYTLEEDKLDMKSIVKTIRLNQKDQDMIRRSKLLLQQPKDTSTMRQLMEIGYYTLHHSLEGHILKKILNNLRRNKRLGIVEVE